MTTQLELSVPTYCSRFVAMPSSPPVLMSWFAVAGVAAAAMGYLYRSASVAVVSALVGTAAILLDEALAKRREQAAAGQAQADAAAPTDGPPPPAKPKRTGPCVPPWYACEAFPNSVTAPAEGAILTWTAEHDVGGVTTPPAIPVMIAAMLRRPVLDVFLNRLSEAAAEGDEVCFFTRPFMFHFTAGFLSDTSLKPVDREKLVRRHEAAYLPFMPTAPNPASEPALVDSSPMSSVMCYLAATGDLAAALSAVESINMKLAPPPGYHFTSFPINPALTCLGNAVVTLIANGDVAGCITSAMHATKRDKGGEHSWTDEQPRRNGEDQLCKLLLPEPLASVMADALRSRFDADVLTAVAPALLERYNSRDADAPRSGDLAALTAQLPLTPTAADWHGLTTTVAAHVKAHRLEPKTILAALDRVDRADVAVAVLAAHHSELRIVDSTSELNRVLLALDRHELRHRLAHHGWTCPTAHVSVAKAMISACALTMGVWNAAGESALSVADTAYIADRTFLRAKSTAAIGGATAAAVADRATFEKRWRAFTGGFFDDFDWRYVVAAGGAVVACLDPQVDVTAAAANDALRPKDVDLFIHGVTQNGITEICAAIEVHARRFTEAHPEAGGYMTLLTSNTMTIIFGNPALPRVQVPLGFWWSVEDVLVTADVDCCCVAYDGSTVVASARGMLAWTQRCNTGLDSHNAVRGSPTYEMRLWKYAQRHGFGVYVATTTDDELSALRHELAAIPRSRKAARQMATSACGLRWVAAVDAGLITPTMPADPLALAISGQTLAELRSAFETEGYIASDNYGNHEAGYAVVADGPDPELRDRAVHDLTHFCIPQWRTGFNELVSGGVWESPPRTALSQAIMLKPNDEVAFMPIKWQASSLEDGGIDDEG
jgi:hypothetical protein